MQSPSNSVVHVMKNFDTASISTMDSTSESSFDGDYQSLLLNEAETVSMNPNLKGDDAMQIVTDLVEMQKKLSSTMQAMVASLSNKVDEQAREIRSLKAELKEAKSSASMSCRSLKVDLKQVKSLIPGRARKPELKQTKSLPSLPRTFGMDHSERDEADMVIAGMAIKQAVYADNVLKVMHELSSQQKTTEAGKVQLHKKIELLQKALEKTKKAGQHELRTMRKKIGELQIRYKSDESLESTSHSTRSASSNSSGEDSFRRGRLSRTMSVKSKSFKGLTSEDKTKAIAKFLRQSSGRSLNKKMEQLEEMSDL